MNLNQLGLQVLGWIGKDVSSFNYAAASVVSALVGSYCVSQVQCLALWLPSPAPPLLSAVVSALVGS